MLILRYLLGLLPIVWIFFRIDLEKFIFSLKNTALWTIPAMIIFTILAMFLQGIRWWMLINAFLPNLPLGKAINCHFQSLYYSIFLPTSASQDIVRSILLSKGNDYGVIWGATWLSRVLGGITLLLMSLYGLFTIDKKLITREMVIFILLSTLIVIILFLVSFYKRISRIFRYLFSKLLTPKIRTTIEYVRESIYRYRNRKKIMILAFLVTVICQVLLVLNSACILKGITGKFFIAECFMFIPIIELVCMSLPLTPNGIGIRETLLSLMFSHLGLSSEYLGSYIIISLGSFLLKIVGGIPLLSEFIASILKQIK
ncbi:MAG: flippase-like domain-containing protein [Chitinispirillaceae bacterium]|nr:flippase-like domain-containing protein [Chitinispirillaceae bacterium]